MKNTLLAIVIAFISEGALAWEPIKLKHCKDHPNVVGACFQFRGKLQSCNGSPSMRIHRHGTTRILGVSDGMALPEYWQVPENVRAVLKSFSSTVEADFEFCPFTHETTGRMQLGCVESATSLVIKDGYEEVQ